MCPKLLPALITASALSFLLTGCSPSDSGSDSGSLASSSAGPAGGGLLPPLTELGSIPLGRPMYIDGCNLGCGSGSGGADVGCSIVDIYENSELHITFSERVDLLSVNAQSFRLTDTGTGATATGTLLRKPGEVKTLVFRPSVEIGPTGELVFGFGKNHQYNVFLPGEAHPDLGPFVQDVFGQKNQSRMDCLVRATRGVEDFVPGDPAVEVFVDLVDQYGNIIPDQPADGAVNVSLQTDIEMVFDDIMATETLLDPATGTSPYISVWIDPDGDTSDQSDQVPLPGTFALALDFDDETTTLTFDPTGDLPPGGWPPLRIAMNLGTVPTDAAGNLLNNPSDIVFTPEGSIPPPTVIGETFDSVDNEDELGSGAEWGQGQLTWAIGGGSGRLGDLVVRSGEELVLNTDSQEFPLPGQPWNLLDNSTPVTDYDPQNQATWPRITVTDGNFEFASVIIETGGTLILQGDQPARLFARGQVVHDGVVEVVGASALDHQGNSGGGHSNNYPFYGQDTKYGGAGGLGGPAAGDGGQGADRMNMKDATLPLMVNIGGIVFDPPYDAVNVGRSGAGVGGGSGSGVSGTEGLGGVHWPPNLPSTNNMNLGGFGDVEISVIPPNDWGGGECGVGMVAGPGSGGAYSMIGGDGVPSSPYIPVNPGILRNFPADTPGGDRAPLGLEPPGDETGAVLIRHLDWILGHLRGGSGGGGGGLSLYGGRLNSGGPPACNNASLFPFFDHSGAGGGGGGGAVQVVAGRLLTISGIIDCGGGHGGSVPNPGTTLLENCDHSGNTGAEPDCQDFTCPGGGGSGGAIKLQSRDVVISPLASRLIASGGIGGIGPVGSLGGDGSPGLLRIERESFVDFTTDADLFAPAIEPYYPDGGTPPPPPGFNSPYTSAMILSVGPWGDQEFRPASFGGATSCWMKPDVTSWKFQPLPDQSGDPLALADTKGWNLKVRYSTPGGVKEFWYRGQSATADPDNPLHGITDYESYLGTLLNHDQPANSGSLFTLRFQGVRALADHDLCDLDLTDDGGQIEPGSLTHWVRHPAELNLFGGNINRIRFCVVLEPQLRSSGAIERNIIGITDLTVSVQPY